MRPKLRPRTVDLMGDCYLRLDPDEDEHRSIWYDSADHGSPHG